MIVRSSSYSCFKTCPRKAYYKYKLGLLRNGSNSSDLGFGKAVHAGIEAFHLTGDINEAIKVCLSFQYPTTAKKNQTTAMALLHIYKAKNNISIVEPEIAFEFPIGKHTWKGKLDGLGQHSADNQIYVVEHKTTNPRMLMLKPNDQFISYFIGSNHVYDQEVVGVAVNNLDPDKIALNKLIVTYAKSEVDYWLRETEFVIDYYAFCESSGNWPRNPNACSLYGRACQYHELCQNPTHDSQLIKQLYAVNEEALNLSW